MKSLNDKVAIVTGASSGIGRATAKLFAIQGARVVVTARRGDELAFLVEEIRADGGQAIACAGDITDEVFSRSLVDVALRHYGKLDIAINNAGTLGASLPADEMTLSDWNKTINTNLTSIFLAAKYQLPAMIKSGGGSMVLVSSVVGYTVGLPGMSDYSASKAGLIGFAKALAVEYAARGIRVNALLPGGTDTPMGREASSTPEAIAFVESLHALKRLAQPEEIAQSALYLASDNASFTTGIALPVDGGISINKT